MKKITWTLFLVFGFSWAKSFAQDTTSVSIQQVPLAILRKLEQDITLSSQQKPLVLEILLERSKQLDQIKTKEKNPSKASFQAANEQALAKLKIILTKEQHGKWLLLRQNDQQQKKGYPEKELYKTVQDLELDL